MAPTIGIAGAGLAGRLLGTEMLRRGWRVTLFDRDGTDGRLSCTWASAGMLAPSCELESAEPEVFRLGVLSLHLWPELLSHLTEPVDFRRRGSVVVAHARDRGDLDRFERRIRGASPHPEFLTALGRTELAQLEPALATRFEGGLYVAHEGQVDNGEVLSALGATLREGGATWHERTPVDAAEPYRIRAGGRTHTFDWVADCRGLGAKPDVANLRGVRGELLYLEAPEVQLTRPVRLMHPRYPLYVVPRKDDVYVVGATSIESEDAGPLTVRSALELLSAAYAVHTGFAEARVLESRVACRPAFPDNIPRLTHRRGLVRLNGLYRHGFLLTPALVRFACRFLHEGTVDPEAGDVIVAA